MRETALGLIAAFSRLNPVLAQFSLVFAVGIDLHIVLVASVGLLLVGAGGEARLEVGRSLGRLLRCEEGCMRVVLRHSVLWEMGCWLVSRR